MKRYGFEREFFIKGGDGKFALTPENLPHDECGYLLEARSTPDMSPLTAVYLLRASVERLRRDAQQDGYDIQPKLDTVTLPRDLVRTALRTNGKRVSRTQGNMYGHEYPLNGPALTRAGLHVHFSNQDDVWGISKSQWDEKRSAARPYQMQRNLPLDMPKIIRTLDVEFAREIKAAKRLPGAYELKHHGFEYRSLPQSVDLDRLVLVLEQIDTFATA